MQLLSSTTKKELGWTPYFWLIYLGFAFINPITNHENHVRWFWLAAALIVFLNLYYLARQYHTWRSKLAVLGIVVLGMAYMPFNGGACVFFIYAAAFLPFIVSSRLFFVFLGSEVAVILLETWLLHIRWEAVVSVIVFSIMASGSNLHFAEKARANKKLQLAQDEIEHLAKVAERERIARDLHDVLGHTLSLITLKSELAGTLLDKNTPQQAVLARNEVRDIEQTARQALAEVRQALVGYRSKGFAAEVERAQRTLKAAGVQLQYEPIPPALTPAAETVLSLALREAVTNIVRHADAHTCRLRLSEENNYISLVVEDDGRGGVFLEGNGLRGMRERVEAFGGHFACEGSAGTRIVLGLPTAIHPEAVSL